MHAVIFWWGGEPKSFGQFQYLNDKGFTSASSSFYMLEAVTRGDLYKKVFLKFSQNSQENTCARASFLIKLQAETCNFISKETLAQLLSCKFCEIFKNTFFYRKPIDDCLYVTYGKILLIDATTFFILQG